MSTTRNICALAVVISLVLTQFTDASYRDCEMECLFAAFRKPVSLCKCNKSVKLSWGKRTPRPRTRKLPTFRYGKRESPFVNTGFNDLDESRLDTLRTIQALNEGGEYDI